MEEEQDPDSMNRLPTKQPKEKSAIIFEEVSSMEWEFIQMNDQEEDLIKRMYRLVGDRWDLIAGRIPGRTAEEIERFWMMQNSPYFEEKRKESIASTLKS
ncbi:MYB-like transcription factor ETC3 [Impatiens glandulifera]|uniref:MYB-like transcription factor ETC3 n=1 Tax=Impatiens glandulifera TaxID=253017 RepID=UPI001FB0A2E7|nr:MYB-like transcription factor ETC3 [Impatiens glandulifera]